jgi:hypothetical protein
LNIPIAALQIREQAARDTADATALAVAGRDRRDAALCKALQAVNEELAIVGLQLRLAADGAPAGDGPRTRRYVYCAGENAPANAPRVVVTLEPGRFHARFEPPAPGQAPFEFSAPEICTDERIYDFMLVIAEALTSARPTPASRQFATFE